MVEKKQSVNKNDNNNNKLNFSFVYNTHRRFTRFHPGISIENPYHYHNTTVLRLVFLLNFPVSLLFSNSVIKND